MTYITAILSVLLLLSACNNDRTQRLNASGNCQEDRDSVTFELSEDETKLLKSSTLPEDERLVATSFSTSVELVTTDETKVLATLTGQITGQVATASVNCTNGLTPNSVLAAPVTFSIPTQNGSGDFTILEITIEGRAGENKNLPFSATTVEIVNPVDSAADDSELPPRPFTSYFEGEETAVYQRKEGKNKENEFSYHITSENLSEGLVKATTRIILNKVITKK